MYRFLLIMLVNLSIVGCQSLDGNRQNNIAIDNNRLAIAILAEDIDRLPGGLVQQLNIVTTNTADLDGLSIDALLISSETLFSARESTILYNELRNTLIQNKVLLIHNTDPNQAAQQLGLELSSQMRPQTERYIVGSLAQLPDGTNVGGGVLLPLTAPAENSEVAQDIRGHLQEVINLQHRFSR